MDECKPRFPIRRFDVFADYQRVRNEQNGMPEYLAKGRGIWAAKVVAGRRYGSIPQGTSAKPEKSTGANEEAEKEPDDSFRSVGGVPQTDGTFDKEIIQRMGAEFYHQVFHPAILEAVNQGKRYEEIRDAIRKEWK